MYHEITNLRNFYYQTRLGRSVQRRIQNAVIELWPDARAEVLLGYGFASPFLRPLRYRFHRVVNLMPEGQGVMAWPPGERNVSALCTDIAWPMGAGGADHILVAHALETTDDISALLAEVWRVLAPEGRAIFVISNRNGVWANSDGTPFGFGRPFSYGQARRILAQHQFKITQKTAALYAPPWPSRVGMRMVGALEWLLGGKRRKMFAGALLIEVRKNLEIMPPRIKIADPVFASPALAPATRRDQL